MFEIEALTQEWLRIEKRRRVFFRGTHLVTDLYHWRRLLSFIEQVSSAFSRRSKKLAKKTAKNNTYRSKIKIPTLYCLRQVGSWLHCKFRNGAWRPRAAFQDSEFPNEDRIIDIDGLISLKQYIGTLPQLSFWVQGYELMF